MNNTNGTNEDNFYKELYNTISIVTLPLVVVGFICNLFLLFVIRSHRDFYKPTYYLIAILTISDIIVSITMIYGFSQLFTRTVDKNTASAMCKSAVYITFASYTISILTLDLIAIDKYFALARPSSAFYLKYKNKFLVTAEISIWIFAFIINAPVIAYFESKDKDYGLCDFIDITISISIYIIVLVVFLYIIPSILIIVMHAKIIRFQKNYVRPFTIEENRQANLRNKKLIKALMYIALSNVCITWPYFATLLGNAITQTSYFQLRASNKVVYVLSLLSRSITASIIIVSPFTYFKFDRNIRKRAKVIIKQIFNKD